MIPIVSIVAKSSSGKTTLLEGLIAELKQRGYRLAAIKHSAHGFDLDHPGTDSCRLSQAGSDTVAIVMPQMLALIKRMDNKSFAQLARVILDRTQIEGYSHGKAGKGRRDRIIDYKLKPEAEEFQLCVRTSG